MSVYVMSHVWKHGPKDQGALLVLLALADFADDEGHCWPAVSSVAAKARMSERNARRVLRKLEADGYLVTVPSSGRTSNRYKILSNPDNMSASVQPGHLRHPTRTNGALNPDICDTNPDTAMSAEPSIEPSRTIKEPSDGFDAFWAEVPRKVGRGQAVKAYRAALKKTDAKTLLSGIRRYAKERAGKDQQYTAHPATWLNGERWADAPTERPADFHDKLDERLKNGTDLRGAYIADSRGAERLPAPVQSPGTHGRADGPGADQADGGSHEQTPSGWYRPRRFG